MDEIVDEITSHIRSELKKKKGEKKRKHRSKVTVISTFSNKHRIIGIKIWKN